GGATPKRAPAAESDAGRQIDRIDAIDYAVAKKVISTDDARNAALGVVGGEETPEYLLVAGGTAPAHKTGVGSTAITPPSSGLSSSWAQAAEWVGKVASKAIGSQEKELTAAIGDAVLQIAQDELNTVVDQLPYAKAIRYAVRYSIMFAEGAGVVMDDARTNIQRIVDDAANFSDNDGPDPEKMRRATAHMALGWTATVDALEAGLQAVIDDLLANATDALAEAGGKVAVATTNKIVSKFLAAVQIDRAYLAVAREVQASVPEARRRVYGVLAKKLARTAIAQISDKTRRTRLEAVLAGTTSTEDPTVGLLRSLVELGISTPTVRPLAGAIPNSIDVEYRIGIEAAVEHEIRVVCKGIIAELKAKGWTIGTHGGSTGAIVDTAAKSIRLPSLDRADFEFGPPTSELGLLEETLSNDEAAYATVYDLLDGVNAMRATTYQAAVESATGGVAISRYGDAVVKTESEAADATASARDIGEALRSTYEGTELEGAAASALHATVVEPVGLRPPRTSTPTNYV
ncbi:MAG: hypothetical protein ABL966_13130, partial [Acidimicrobiales bacterium]